MEPAPETKIEKLRAQWLAELPRWYLPIGHFCATVGICAIAIVVSARHLSLDGWPSALVVLGNLVFANFFEWMAHKYAMHRSQWPLKVLYEKHTLMHHRLYHEDSMPLKDWRELAFVLIPSAGILGVLVSAAIACSVVGLTFGAGYGWLAILTQASYVLFYELSHLSYHLPAGHWVRKIPGHSWLASQHAKHHDPKFMNTMFNITFPLADLVLGTYRRPK